MKSKLSCLFLILLLSALANGQLTAVSATVQDTAGQTWNNGAFVVDFIRSPTQIGTTPLFNGSPFLEHYPISPLDTGGAFTINLQPVTSITPSGGLWRFTVCPNATAPCSALDVPVTGLTMDISAILTAAMRVPALNGSPVVNKAYGDTELNVSAYIPNSQATLYYDVTLQCLKFFDGSAWHCIAGGGGVIDITATAPIVVTPNPITGTGDISCPSCITSIPTDTDFYQVVENNGTPSTQRLQLNFVPDDNIILNFTDDATPPGTTSIAIHPVITHTCIIDNDTQSVTPLTDAQITGRCDVFPDSTLLEIDVYADAGTPSVQLERFRPNGGATADLLSGVLPTGAVGSYACAMPVASATCASGIISNNTIIVVNRTLLDGDVIRVKAGTATAGGVATWHHIAATYQANP